MEEFVGELLIIVGMSVANGVFAMTEIAVVSSRRARLQHLADEGDAAAKIVLGLLDSPERFLSTVQVGITAISIVAGAFAGATIARPIAAAFDKIPWLDAYSGPLALIAVAVLITYLQVVFGELVPKQIALRNPDRIARLMAVPTLWMIWAARPIVIVLGTSSRAVLTALRVKDHGESTITEEEIKIVLEQGADAGVLERAEHTLVERVMELGDRRVESLMTPRTEITWIDIHAPIGESIRTMSVAGHTYFPVCDGGVENVLGIVSIKDLWTRMANRELPSLKDCIREVPYVPETMPALKLLETFKQTGKHLALVVDEYGGISGMVTLHNVLEAIVGDAASDLTERSQRAVRRADGSWLLDGMLSNAELRELLELEELPGEEGDYQTLAGMLLTELGRIPRVTDSIEWGGFKFEVMDMDGHRIDKVLAAAIPPASEPAAQ